MTHMYDTCHLSHGKSQCHHRGARLLSHVLYIVVMRKYSEVAQLRAHMLSDSAAVSVVVLDRADVRLSSVSRNVYRSTR